MDGLSAAACAHLHVQATEIMCVDVDKRSAGVLLTVFSQGGGGLSDYDAQAGKGKGRKHNKEALNDVNPCTSASRTSDGGVDGEREQDTFTSTVRPSRKDVACTPFPVLFSHLHAHGRSVGDERRRNTRAHTHNSSSSSK